MNRRSPECVGPVSAPAAPHSGEGWGAARSFVTRRNAPTKTTREIRLIAWLATSKRLPLCSADFALCATQGDPTRYFSGFRGRRNTARSAISQGAFSLLVENQVARIDGQLPDCREYRDQ